MQASLRRLWIRVFASCLGIELIAWSVLAMSVMVYSRDSFSRLLTHHGMSLSQAEAMYDRTVAVTFALATAAAMIVGGLLAMLLARHLTGPLDRLGAAARRMARGDYSVRVSRSGPTELISLADSFNQMAEAMEQARRTRSELISNFAHELRTPLTNLRGYMEALRDGVMEPTPELFRSLSEEIERLARLSRALDSLDESNLENTEPELRDLDVAEAIRAAVELARPGLQRRGLSLRLNVPAHLRGRANPDHLAQVLGNLLQNAIRYTPAGGEVEVTARVEPDSLLVSVINSATLPASELPLIFERFYRVEKSRNREWGGAGIGLAIVKQLVEAGGGQVGAESVEGGTRVWFTLPAGGA